MRGYGRGLQTLCKQSRPGLAAPDRPHHRTREVLSTKRATKLAGIPLEKVRKFTPEQRILWRQSSFLPVAEHNQLIAAGYFGELDSFIQFCETGKASLNQSTPASLKPTYRLLEAVGKETSPSR